MFASLVCGASCFGKPDPLKPDGYDGGLSQYANWGSFLPGTGTVHGEGDVHRVFGQPDGDMLHLGSGGVLTVSFGDTRVYDRPAAEFTIHGQWEQGEAVTVFGSQDGAAYEVIGTVDGADPSVDITRAGMDWVVYLQIQDSGLGDGVEIDAVQVLSGP